jgi:hypothetical protein
MATPIVFGYALLPPANAVNRTKVIKPMDSPYRRLRQPEKSQQHFQLSKQP